MINKHHLLVFSFSFCFTVIVGFLNSSYNSLLEFLLTKTHTLAIIVYSILLNAVCLTGIWIYINSKKSDKSSLEHLIK